VIAVSLVVPCYSSDAYISRCLEALCNQDHPRERYEIILVDNGSEDRSLEIARRYSGVRCLSEPKRGAYAARNRGVAAAQGAVIAFTDSDCAPARDWVSSMWNGLSPGRPGILLGRVRFREDSLPLSLIAAYQEQQIEFITSSRDERLYFGYTNNLATTRATLDALGPFVELGRGADTVFVRRAVEAWSCDAVAYRPEACVDHLEIAGIWHWYEKLFIYGRSAAVYRTISSARPLSTRERLQVFRQTVRQRALSNVHAVLLGCLLLPQGFFFRLGGLLGRIRR
jgi:glycosyltransferase involved in cell wall biosynthesis